MLSRPRGSRCSTAPGISICQYVQLTIGCGPHATTLLVSKQHGVTQRHQQQELTMKSIVSMLSAGLVAVALSGSAWAADTDPLDTVKIQAAKTPADHEAIAKAYEAEAARLEKMAGMHKGLAETYSSQAG